MLHYDVVIVGGGYAGLTAAARLGERGAADRILLLDRKDRFVERIRLHQVATGQTLTRFPYRDFLSARQVEFLQGEVEELRPDARQLTVRLSGSREVLHFTVLLLALGSMTDPHALPGLERRATTLDSMEDGIALAEWARGSGGHLLVVGGGLTGIEAATELAEQHRAVEVTLVSSRPFTAGSGAGAYTGQAIAHLRRTFDRLRIKVIEGDGLVHLDKSRATLASGRVLEFDRCIWAGGFRVPALPAQAGLAVSDCGRVLCMPTLQSLSHPQVVVAGDVAEAVVEPGGLCRMSCAAGRPMGEAAARTVEALVAGRQPEPFRFAYTFRCVSLGRNDGLIQFVDAQDRPLNEIWTGERAARWKEYVCRRTVAGVGLQAAEEPPDRPPVALTSADALLHYGEA